MTVATTVTDAAADQYQEYMHSANTQLQAPNLQQMESIVVQTANGALTEQFIVVSE